MIASTGRALGARYGARSWGAAWGAFSGLGREMGRALGARHGARSWGTTWGSLCGLSGTLQTVSKTCLFQNDGMPFFVGPCWGRGKFVKLQMLWLAVLLLLLGQMLK